MLAAAIPAVQLGADVIVPGTFDRPALLFWVVVLAAGQCVLLAFGFLVHSVRRNRAEPALLGAFLLSVSMLPLAHGILTPGVLYEPNDGSMATVQLAVLVGALALVPFARGRSGLSNRLASRWRSIVIAHVALTVSTFVVVLVDPDVVPAAETASPAAIAIAVASLTICLLLSARQQRLAVLAQSPSLMGVAVGLILIGSAPLIFIVGDPWGSGFWLAHFLDIFGVTAVTLSAFRAYRRGRTMTALLAPIEAATPLRAVEIGLDPVVHDWVSALDTKDEQTRDHVIRTAQMAVLVAGELGLPAQRVRLAGVGAILHDVGKLDIPDEILTKPGRLTAEERAVMETHAMLGAAKLESSPVLADAAPIVAAHHERIDGRGYPSGLTGDDIPIEARVISACDAYDAITNTRHYREKMSGSRAEAILREHAGSQWDADVVDALLAVVTSGRVSSGSDVGLETVGRPGPSVEAEHLGRVCHDAVPDVVEAAAP